MDDLEHQLEEPCQGLHQRRDGELQSQGAPAFPDALPAHPLDAAESDAWDDERLPDPSPVLMRDVSHMERRQGHPILVGEGVRKSACRAACRPASGLHLRGQCRSVADLSAA